MSKPYLLYAGLLAFIVAVAILIHYIRFKRGEKIVPHSVGQKTIYLRRSEVPHFESLGREEQRRYVVRFEAQVKDGKYTPIYKRGKIIGYVRKTQWKKR